MRLLLLLPFLLTGCLSVDQSTGDFAPTPSLRTIAGTYRNQGTTATGRAGDVRLSQLLWPDDAQLRHGEIATIEVTSTSPRTLHVVAKNQVGRDLKTGDYEEARDFRLNGTTLRLAGRNDSTGFRSGEPMIGVVHSSVELGLDADGQGKARRTEAANGLVYGLIPMSVGAARDLRFEKLR
jgi:hypothetical protein